VVVFSTSAPEQISAGFRTIVAMLHRCWLALAFRHGWHRSRLHL